jgi:CSLREA domain-containing protein
VVHLGKGEISVTLRHRLAPSTSIVVLLLAGILTGAPAARAAAFTVTRFDDPAPGSCVPGDCSLREAVNAANAAGGPDQVIIPPGTFTLSIPADGSPDDGADGDLDIQGDVTITGAGQESTVVNANGGVTADRAFDVDTTFDATHLTVAFADLTIRGGAGGLPGRGIETSDQANTTLTRVTLSGNGGGDFGGAISNSDGSAMTIVDSLITGNTLTGSFGGGISHQGGSLTISNSTLSGNSVGGSFGGAV